MTNHAGLARLRVRLSSPDAAANGLYITAAASRDGANLIGSAHLDMLRPGADTDAGEIVIRAETECDPAWIPTFGGLAGVHGYIHAFTVFDDGEGPALYAAGFLTSAGGVATNNIARWDGETWSALGSGLNSVVKALVVYDDGSGPALYAGGYFSSAGGAPANRIARWDGESWTDVDGGLPGATIHTTVNTLAVFDDGDGPALFVGGGFTTAGNAQTKVTNFARWDGESWSSPVDPALGPNSVVRTLAVYDDGTGPALYLGGSFSFVGEIPASGIIRWDGQSWSSLGSGLSGYALSMCVFDDGSGPALYVGGSFGSAGGVVAPHIARWDGQSWSSLGAGVNNQVRSLAVFDEGAGPVLFAGGSFTQAGGAPASRIASWDGGAWSLLGDGVSSDVNALVVYRSAPEEPDVLYVGGQFAQSGGESVSSISRWNGDSWSPLGAGLDNSVWALTVFDDGSGPALYAAGAFRIAMGTLVNRIARWNGDSWSPLGAGINNHVWALTVFDDGTGPALYAGGLFTMAGDVEANRIARWDGESWSPLGSGVNHNFVRALTVFDDGNGPALYAGGNFTMAGGAPASGVARWDGDAWSDVGGGVNGNVSALTVYDDQVGGGPQLYVGGGFTMAGQTPASSIARWNGQNWSPVGAGMNGSVRTLVGTSMEMFGGEPGLVAGGSFSQADGLGVSNIARWDGLGWRNLNSGLRNGSVRALVIHDDGCGGPAVYAAGSFTATGATTSLPRIARWMHGTGWTPLGDGLHDTAHTLAVFDDGSGLSLFVGGEFFVSPAKDSALARWRWRPQKSPPCPADLNGDGLVGSADLGALLGSWGPCQDCPADLDGDGQVGSADLGILLGSWGVACR